MIDLKLLNIIYPKDEYLEHTDSFNDDVENIELRFTTWAVENKTQLKSLFIEMINYDNLDALQLSYVEWARQMFICWDYNTTQTNIINKEIEDMLNGI